MTGKIDGTDRYGMRSLVSRGSSSLTSNYIGLPSSPFLRQQHPHFVCTSLSVVSNFTSVLVVVVLVVGRNLYDLSPRLLASTHSLATEPTGLE